MKCDDPRDALTLHLLFAKFFLICRLTDSWMFLQSAVSPAILGIKATAFTNTSIIQHAYTGRCRNGPVSCSCWDARAPGRESPAVPSFIFIQCQSTERLGNTFIIISPYETSPA